MTRGVRSSFAIALVLSAVPSIADASELDLRWSAPSECPSSEEVASKSRATASKLGKPITTLSADAHVEKKASSWAVTLKTRGAGGSGERNLEAPTCAGLAAAVELVLALAMTGDPPKPTPSPPPTAPPVTPAPVAPTPTVAPKLPPPKPTSSPAPKPPSPSPARPSPSSSPSPSPSLARPSPSSSPSPSPSPAQPSPSPVSPSPSPVSPSPSTLAPSPSTLSPSPSTLSPSPSTSAPSTSAPSSSTGPSPSTSAPSNPPPAASSSPTSDPPSAPEPERDSQGAPSALPASAEAPQQLPGKPSSPRPPLVYAGASLASDFSTLPGATFGGSIVLGITPSIFRFELDARRWAERTQSLPTSDAGAAFTLTTLGARACVRALKSGDVDLSPCLGADLQLLQAKGYGSDVNSEGNTEWASLTGGALGRLAITPWLAVRARAEAFAALARPRFVIENEGLVYRTPTLGASVSIGAEVHFF